MCLCIAIPLISLFFWIWWLCYLFLKNLYRTSLISRKTYKIEKLSQQWRGTRHATPGRVLASHEKWPEKVCITVYRNAVQKKYCISQLAFKYVNCNVQVNYTVIYFTHADFYFIETDIVIYFKLLFSCTYEVITTSLQPLLLLKQLNKCSPTK